jgi:hypothetical protein
MARARRRPAFGSSPRAQARARECAIALPSPEGVIHVQDAAHFCASKLEAFAGRGEGDLYQSLLAVIDAFRIGGARQREVARRALLSCF